MTTINITRNVYQIEDVPISVSDDYVARYPVARMDYLQNVDVLSPDITTEISAMSDTPTYVSISQMDAVLQGGTFVYYSGSCAISSCQLLLGGGSVNGQFQTLSSPTDYHGMGSYIDELALGMKSWIAFTVNESQGASVISATLKLTCSETRSRRTVNVKMGCQSYSYSTPLLAPTTYNDMNSRVLTNSVSYFSTSNGTIADWVLNTGYDFDITGAVQEILNKPSWVSGSTMAVMIHNNGSTANMDREFWAATNATQAYEPRLTIVR